MEKRSKEFTQNLTNEEINERASKINERLYQNKVERTRKMMAETPKIEETPKTGPIGLGTGSIVTPEDTEHLNEEFVNQRF